MKAVGTKTPENVAVDFAAIPSHQNEAMCRTLMGCLSRMFENPAVKADYERWKREREQNAAGVDKK